jgi:hypothetical protein
LAAALEPDDDAARSVEAGFDAGLLDPDALDPGALDPGALDAAESDFGVAAADASPPSLVAAAGCSSDRLAALRAAAPRSFLAQPDPLKWIAGVTNPLRTGPPPQAGQVVGPSAWTPWITSKRCPQ